MAPAGAPPLTPRFSPVIHRRSIRLDGQNDKTRVAYLLVVLQKVEHSWFSRTKIEEDIGGDDGLS
jgi:hypothetical protein